MGTPEWNIVDADEIFPKRTFIEKGITMKKVLIVVGVLFLGCVLGVASVQAKDPEKIQIGQCNVIKYSEKVYWFFSGVSDQSRDNFGLALVDLIGQKDIEGYEVSAVSAHQAAGYWVVFKKKPSFPPSQDVALFPQLDHPFFKGW